MDPVIPESMIPSLVFRSRRTVMRFCMVLSLLFHTAVLLAVQKAFPIHWISQPLQTYHVELIRPPVLPLDEESASGANLAKIKPQEQEEPEKAEETISLETRDERYTSYARVIKERLMRLWLYPPEARENLIEGDVRVLFSLNRQGKLLRVEILEASPYAVLEEEAARTVRAAAPYPNFPGSVHVRKLHIKANFSYRLTAEK